VLGVKSALYSLTIAVIVMFALPISQLRTVAIAVQCCCPDPTRCHCPDHGKDTSQQPSIKACHKTSQTFEAPTVQTFTPVAIESVSAPVQAIATVDHALTHPHQPPSLAAPRGPS
jgi:hypothetical protein